MNGPPKERGPVAVTTEAPCNSEVAIAGPTYPHERLGCKPILPSEFAHSARAREGHKNPRRQRVAGRPSACTFRAQGGLTVVYRGKRARVLDLLVDASNGVTQWDCLPWHTRLGGTIHAMRRDGLEISTELEGEDRHARYRLHTRGSLIIQDDNREGGGNTPGRQ